MGGKSRPKELLFTVSEKDLIIQTFGAGGPGGQNQNKRWTGVRITHPDSGAVGESREERSQLANKRTALKRLTESGKFRLWVSRKVQEINTGRTLEERVDEQMKPENIRVQVMNEHSQWVDWTEADEPAPSQADA